MLTVVLFEQIGTTKGTGGDVLILEEAAYCDEGFFYGLLSDIVLKLKHTNICTTRNRGTYSFNRPRKLGGDFDIDE